MHKPRRRKSPYFQTVGNILQGVLKKRHLSFPAKDPRVWEAWNRSVGPIISAQTSCDKFQNGTLFVKVAHSAWVQQLQFMKNEIIEKINVTLGREAVKNIYFTLGHVTAPKPGDAEPLCDKPDPLNEKDRKNVELCTSEVRDSELKEILKRVMMKDLIRRRQREG